MLHIILLILKMLGILLLSMIGIICILILVVLFVPIRYKVRASKYSDIQIQVVVSWLFHCISYLQVYNGSKMMSKIRIMGFVIKDSENPKTKKVKKSSKKKRKIKRKQKGKKKEPDVMIAEIVSEGHESHKAVKKGGNNRLILEEPGEKRQERIPDKFQEKSIKTGLVEKLKKIIRVIKSIFNKISEFFIKIKTTYFNVIEKKDQLIRRVSTIRSFLKQEENKIGIKKIWWAIKRLLKHIFPRRLRVNIRFGTGDPCSTGQLLGVIGLTYHLYQKNVTIIPDFTEEVYEGDIFAKGRIRMFVILVISIRVILDKNFKQLLKGFNELKEEL